MRALELYAGIGGMHAACPWLEVAAAVDINRDSQRVYSENFATPYHVRELETIPPDWLASQRADLWWMSPPCTPFTRKGVRRDNQDIRTRSLIHLIDAAAIIRPASIVVENVVGLESSQTFEYLSEVWRQVGYRVQAWQLCPTQLGWPNRRPRIYVIATLGPPPVLPTPKPAPRTSLKELIGCREQDPGNSNDLYVDPNLGAKYRSALDIIDLEDFSAIAACFGSSYGRAITKAGSYVLTEHGLRRFSPREIANILGFPPTFLLPNSLSVRRLWQLLGNSLSLPAVSHIMKFTQS